MYLLWGGERLRCRARDLSSRGVFVNLDAPSVPSDTNLEAVFALNYSLTTVLLRRLPGRVVRVEQSGLALNFW